MHAQFGIQHQQRFAHRLDNVLGIDLCGPSTLLGFLDLRHIEECHDDAINHVMDCAVRQDAHQEILPVCSRQLPFPHRQRPEHLFHVLDKTPLAYKLGREVREGPACITGNEPEHSCGRRGEAPYVQSRIQKNCGDLRAVEQILQVAIGMIELGYFAVEFVVDRFQLFVERLKLLLGSFQLLVRRLILFVCGF